MSINALHLENDRRLATVLLSLGQQIERYVKEHSAAEFSHGICPDCLRTYYPEYSEPAPGQADRATGDSGERSTRE